MKPNIDFKECLKDSPKFRESLEDAEQDIDILEIKLDKLTKLCQSMVEAGKVFSNANSAFIVGLRDMAAHLKDDQLTEENCVSEALSRFTQVLTESQKYQVILLDQAHRSIVKSLNNFMKIDIRAVKETRRYFEKISNDLDLALTKNSQVARSKPQEFQDIDNFLVATKSCFSHTSLDYVFQINVLHSKKKCEILTAVLGYMHAQNTYFHQGSDLFVDLEKYMKKVAIQLEHLSTTSDLERRDMEKRHMLVQQTGLISLPAYEIASEPGTGGDEENNCQDVKMEGYLFKRTSNTFKTWVRRWFQILNNQLIYRKRSKDTVTIMEDDLRLCTVRPYIDTDRRFCFEVVSPTRSHVLQADTDCDSLAWIQAIQAGVSKAYNQRQSIDVEDQLMGSINELTNSVKSERTSRSTAIVPKDSTIKRNHTTMKNKISKALVQTMLDIPGSNQCCDCATPNPSWASINLGITLCIECSGIHRSLGVHVSKVRSITLDDWEQDLLKVMLGLGNEIVNQIYEANVDESIAERAMPGCSRAVREAWIKAKYVQKAFTKHIDKLPAVNRSPSKTPLRRWSVCKKKRKSPGRHKQKTTDSSTDSLTTSDGKGSNTALSSDVVVFGTAVNSNDHFSQAKLNLIDSEDDSVSDGEPDEDVCSTTSLEDMTRLNADMLLYKASRARNLSVMLEAMALGANVNWQNEDDGDRTPLIQAIQSGSMTTVEFLLLNGAKVDVADCQSQGPLHHATIMGHTGQVCQLLKRHANQHARDKNGHDPLNIAIENANADIVTLLRLAKLNEEMQDSEGCYGVQVDETVNDVFKDFTNLANSAPERLARNK